MGDAVTRCNLLGFEAKFQFNITVTVLKTAILLGFLCRVPGTRKEEYYGSVDFAVQGRWPVRCGINTEVKNAIVEMFILC